MSSDNTAGAAPIGIVRVPLNPNTKLYDLPRNHHGEPIAPLTAAGQPFRMCWTDTNRAELVFAETAEDLLAYWIPEYREADTGGRALLRAQHAVQVRTSLVPELVIDAEERGVTISAGEEVILVGDLADMPDLSKWDSTVPLVLLEGMYKPFTDRLPPVSGIDGDVREPSNIIWLRNAHPEEYIRSLALAGVIQIDISKG